MTAKESIGLIGIGLAGTALAERLLGAGFAVVGYDIEAAKCARLEALGGAAAVVPAEVANRCRRVFLSLMTTEIVCQVVEGPNGLLTAEFGSGTSRPCSPVLDLCLPASARCKMGEKGKRGNGERNSDLGQGRQAFIIDTTTGDPDETAALAGRLARRGVGYLDATLSGSSQQIREGKAVFMVGGKRAAFEACRDLLGSVAQKVFHLGPPGSGAKAKLASNLVLGLNRAALAEGIVFAERLGLDLAVFLELLKDSPARSAVMDAKGAKMLASDFEPQARLAQHHKDVTLILKYARKHGQGLPLSEAHMALLAAALEAGDGELDNAAVIREIRRRKL